MLHKGTGELSSSSAEHDEGETLLILSTALDY